MLKVRVNPVGFTLTFNCDTALVRYGNVPLPKAGAHFHVLQSHGNRYSRREGNGEEKIGVVL